MIKFANIQPPWLDFSARRELGAPDHLHDAVRSGGEQRILVTGTTREDGLGYQSLKTLSELGHRVATHYRGARMERGHALLRKLYPAVECTNFDLLKESPQPMSIQHEAGQNPYCEYRYWVENRFGKLDALILNAGETGLTWQPDDKRLIGERVSRWVESNAQMIQHLVPLLHDFDSTRPQGRILFVSSAQAEDPKPGIEPYGKIKRQTEELLHDVFQNNARLKDILPIIVRPGSCNTEMHREVLAKGSPELKAWRTNLANQGLLRDPHIVGEIIAGIALTGCMFNPATRAWDQTIPRLGVAEITDEVIKAFEASRQEALSTLPSFREKLPA